MLSITPLRHFVRPLGLEPRTPWLRVRCCHQLSYGRLWRVRPLRFELRTPWLKVRCSKNRWATSAYYFFCAPEGTRTLDPLIKSQVHLPTELRALTFVGVCGADPHSLALQASATTVSAKPPIVFHVDEIYWEFRQRYSRFICFLNRVIFSIYFFNQYPFYIFYCGAQWTRTTLAGFARCIGFEPMFASF